MAMSGSGVEKNALNQAGTAAGQASSAYGTISPIYAQEATNPTGYTPQQRANQLTASNQSLGGAVAGAVGQGALYGARTNNAGAATAALDDSARNAMAQQSQNALGVENDNAALMEKQKQEGLAGLNSIYGDANRTGADYLGIANSSQQAAARNKMAWTQMALKAAGGGLEAFA